MGRKAPNFGEDVIAAIGDLAQFLDGLVEVAAFGGVPHGGAMERNIEQVILGAHAPDYRMSVRTGDG